MRGRLANHLAIPMWPFRLGVSLVLHIVELWVVNAKGEKDKLKYFVCCLLCLFIMTGQQGISMLEPYKISHWAYFFEQAMFLYDLSGQKNCKSLKAQTLTWIWIVHLNLQHLLVKFQKLPRKGRDDPHKHTLYKYKSIILEWNFKC